jgi:CxxC motif-containing protein (DUF1111 family)
MTRGTHLRLSHLAVFAALVASPVGGLGAEPSAEELVAQGRELFAREWVPGDSRSHGGDGLGPVYNQRSCLGCHLLGGPGGAGGADQNIEIITATGAGDAFPGTGFSYAFGMSFGAGGFQYRFTDNSNGKARNSARPGTPRVNLADLAQIHAGFRESPSVVLHRYGPDPDYRVWRERVPGPHGLINIRSSQRNPPALFGAGLIDAIPDEVLQAAAKRRFAGWPQIKGRLSKLSDGRIGRFGWKAQTASLSDFIVSAATVELGLEVPSRPQAGDPRIPALAAPGLDLEENELAALTAYVRSLPPPRPGDPGEPRDAQLVKSGANVFKSIGCAHCHLPRLGAVEGIYSDLLLHDMSPDLGDTSVYGVFAGQPAAEAVPAAGAGAGAARAQKSQPAATVQEWRTPPLWGVGNSGPYLHDGRVATLDEAIRSHGGQASTSAKRYGQLSRAERAQLEAFLGSL